HRVRQSDRRRWSGGFGILMTPRDLLTLITLAALWGASFLFIKLAVEDVPPLGVVEMRLLLGAATVAVVLLVSRRRRVIRGMVRPGVLLVGLINAGLPYLCFAWGETRVPSGIAG